MQRFVCETGEEFLRLYGEDSSMGEYFKTCLTTKEIAAAVAKVADHLNAQFSHAKRSILVVGVLRGAFKFLSDLTGLLTFPHTVAFVKCQSCDLNKDDTKHIVENIDVPQRVTSDVVIVDSLWNTGETMRHVHEYLVPRVSCTNTITWCTLLVRGNAKVSCPDVFGVDGLPRDVGLLGYGLDHDHWKKRGWNWVFFVPDTPMSATANHPIFKDDNPEYHNVRQSIVEQCGTQKYFFECNIV